MSDVYEGVNCPIPQDDNERVTMAHGGGGRAMQGLIEREFRARFGDGQGPAMDAAVLPLPAGRLALTTDSFVVQPLFFPGGNIGTLAVDGTVNDLAMVGARARYLTVGFVLEEGLSLKRLREVVTSMTEAATAVGARIVAGDTKVVERGAADGLYINTTGVGVVPNDLDYGPESIRPGDAILVSGDLGRHGIAVMCARQDLEVDPPVESDVMELWSSVSALMDAEVDVHAMRDLTRGGLVAALNELAADSGLEFLVEESAVPVGDDVRGVCEILGFDPLYVANEGRFVMFVPTEEVDQALKVLHALGGAEPAHVGSVSRGTPGRVVARGPLGATRLLDLLSGEQLPRIC